MQEFLLLQVYSKLSSYFHHTSLGLFVFFSVSDKVRKEIMHPLKQTIYEHFPKLLQQFSNFVVFFVSSCGKILKMLSIFCPVSRISTGSLNGNRQSLKHQLNTQPNHILFVDEIQQ